VKLGIINKKAPIYFISSFINYIVRALSKISQTK
jgi:hypothetical protein